MTHRRGRTMAIPLGLLGMAILSAGASAQKPDAGAVLNRMSSAYRSMLSYRDSGTLTQKAGEKTFSADVKLAAQRPNLFALEVSGNVSNKFNTRLWSDGSDLIALRPDRKVYTKTKAPALLMKGDVLGKVDVPAPASRIVTLLLENILRTSDDPLSKSINEATVDGPQPFGDKMAYILNFRYDDMYDARAVVTDGDFLLRKVSLIHKGSAEITETLTDIQVDKPIPTETFAPALPEGAKLVYSLPALEKIVVSAAGPPAPDFKLRTYKGDTIRLSDLKGKVVLLNFFFND